MRCCQRFRQGALSRSVSKGDTGALSLMSSKIERGAVSLMSSKTDRGAVSLISSKTDLGAASLMVVQTLFWANAACATLEISRNAEVAETIFSSEFDVS